MKFVRDEVITELPVRVNFGGGWSDTPPYCIENGGTVLCAAATLDGRLPVVCEVRRLDEYKVILASGDNGSRGEFESIAPLRDCADPADPFALHKAALLACGVIPERGDACLDDILSDLGGGIYINTQVIDIPRGSGLGTSSILGAAVVRSIFGALGIGGDDAEVCRRVLLMEQLMSTGGGWQDQLGALGGGIKLLSSSPGLAQNVKAELLNISEKTSDALSERFCLVYTGQRRLARNLLREVIGRYIAGEESAAATLYEIQRVAVLMKFELEKGNIEGFAELMNRHWELSKRLDSGCTNTCIDQIFAVIGDLISGSMICGAGGGGFLQVLLRDGVSADDLAGRLRMVFADSGVEVRRCRFLT